MQLPIELSNPCYHDEEAARTQLETIRWPDGPFCPYCGSFDRVKQTTTPPKAKGGGWYHCQDCRRKFTVRVGSIFHRSHVPLHKWLLGFRLMAGSKKGFSAHQMHRTLNVDYKTAWFLEHRIRECMKEESGTDPLGGPEKFVEADETFVGGKARNRAYRKPAPKKAVVSLVERSGRARSRHVANVNADNLKPILEAGIDKNSHLRTDESGVYWKVGEEFASHQTVNHSAKEYVRGDAYTNTVEGYFSILKHGIYGVYQHVSAAHLHRYLAEFDFRYSYRIKLGFDDVTRATLAIQGAAGRRLLYRQPGRAA
ncbi:MAG: IS1595 family transposase [Terriglobia bacterium]